MDLNTRVDCTAFQIGPGVSRSRQHCCGGRRPESLRWAVAPLPPPPTRNKWRGTCAPNCNWNSLSVCRLDRMALLRRMMGENRAWTERSLNAIDETGLGKGGVGVAALTPGL